MFVVFAQFIYKRKEISREVEVVGETNNRIKGTWVVPLSQSVVCD
jgi:hypothetical protein